MDDCENLPLALGNIYLDPRVAGASSGVYGRVPYRMPVTAGLLTVSGNNQLGKAVQPAELRRLDASMSVAGRGPQVPDVKRSGVNPLTTRRTPGDVSSIYFGEQSFKITNEAAIAAAVVVAVGYLVWKRL